MCSLFWEVPIRKEVWVILQKLSILTVALQSGSEAERELETGGAVKGDVQMTGRIKDQHLASCILSGKENTPPNMRIVGY